jgi:hypothetical protein
MPAPLPAPLLNHILQRLSVPFAGATPALAGVAIDYNGTVHTATNVQPFGILDSDVAVGGTASVVTAGACEAKSGGAISAGALLVNDGTGRFVATTAGSGVRVVGRALSAATAANQAFRMLITKEGAA